MKLYVPVLDGIWVHLKYGIPLGVEAALKEMKRGRHENLQCWVDEMVAAGFTVRFIK
jgi:hypothetical protein